MASSRHPATGLATPVSETDHIGGTAGAPVVIVEYGDFECPTCKQAAPALKELLVRYVGKLQLVFRHFPLEDGHPHALQAAEAAESAAAQGKFWPMHDLLFDNQLQLRPDQLHDYAEQAGLDMRRYTHDMHAHTWLPKIRQQREDGVSSGVRSTPGIFLNGRIHDVSFGFRSLIEAVDALVAGTS